MKLVDAELTRLLENEVPGLVAAYLFGSRARGDALPDSDVDLAVLCAQPLDPLRRWKLQERIAADLGAHVDLVDLRAASSVMRVRVLADGVILVDRDPALRAHFEALALSEYARLNEERRGILEDVQKSGRVHG